MKNMNTKKIAIIACAFLAAVSLGLLSVKANAQDDVVSSKLSETQSDVTKLLNVKDDTTLTDQERERMEIDLKKKIISDVLDVSLNQIQTSQDQLGKLNLPGSDDWSSVKGFFNKNLETSKAYYQDTQDKLNSVDGSTLSGLNDLAKSLQDKKSSEIDPIIQRLNVVAATVNISDIISVADDRLSKVSADVSKIYSKKLTENMTLQTLLDQASGYVKKAHDFQDRALSTIINVYTSDTGTSTKDFVLSLKENLLKDKENALLTSATATTTTSTDIKLFSSTAPLTSSTTTSTDESLVKPTISQADIDNYLASLTMGAYDSIKSAYDVFVKMSSNVNKYLQ
jgi:hypothetical protein